ncbi:MAG: ribonuclease HI [Clostridia bacterium]|nr:ribonuclease HI [Clostridia bacterium]
MKQVTIYTDGACSGNPGVGGWGCILMYNGAKKELSGNEKSTTNNRMELLAAINALNALKEPCNVELYTDSAYLCNAFLNDWISTWQTNNWRTANKSEVKNRDLWEMLIKLSKTHKINWHKVKGHSDNEFNNRCDELARQAIDKIRNAEFL